MKMSSDFRFSTPFSIREINDRITSYSPRGMIDLLYLDAATPDSTTLHDNLFIDPLTLDNDKKPNVLTKWIVEKELKNDINCGLIEEGKFVGVHYNIS